ncbi:MAG: hypothetical protein AAF449_10270 [Myxococcota bacterium]
MVILIGVIVGCVYRPGKYVVVERADPTLPTETNALLALSDETASLGPGGPDLDRSLAAANRILAAQPNHGEAAWRAARALYLQTYATSDDHGKRTERCLDVSAVATAYSDRAEAHYYKALCMGARANARQIEGLDLVPRMEEAGKAALAADQGIEHAGPHRLLGGIYLFAPAWPASIGDLDLALEHLNAAVELAPDWAENHLLLAHALVEDEQYAEGRAALNRAKKLLDGPLSVGWRKPWQKKIEALEKIIVERE